MFVSSQRNACFVGYNPSLVPNIRMRTTMKRMKIRKKQVKSNNKSTSLLFEDILLIVQSTPIEEQTRNAERFALLVSAPG